MRRCCAGRLVGAGGFSALELLGVVAVITGIAAFLFVWGTRSTFQARDTSCRSNLKQIGLALAMYADDYGGRLPHSPAALPLLAAVYTKNQQMMTCPADPERKSANPPAGYFIVPGLANDDAPATILAGDTQPLHMGRGNVVCLDGRTRSLPAAELQPYRKYVYEVKVEDETPTTGVHAD
jgi:type II secretory pathway pseudopilin PulG